MQRPSEPLSILHVYAGNLHGGIETMLSTLARCQGPGPSLAMEFALCFPGRLREELKSAGASVHDLGPVRFRHPWTLLAARRRLSSLLVRKPFDIVITHASWPHAIFAPVVRRARRRLVFWQHDFAAGTHWIEWVASRVTPDLVLSNSRASATTVPRLFPGAPVEVVYYPVVRPEPSFTEADTRAAIRSELDTPNDAVVVIMASRMEPWKGHTLLIEALARLADRPSWYAWILGGAQRPKEQAYLADLTNRVEAAGIADRVRFLGQRSDVARILQAADIHCQPNAEPEPFGIAFIEALQAGLPVLTTRIGAAIEIVTPGCGILVTPGDKNALAETLWRLIADPSERARLQEGGPGRAEELCHPGTFLARLLDLLSNLVKPASN